MKNRRIVADFAEKWNNNQVVFMTHVEVGLLSSIGSLRFPFRWLGCTPVPGADHGRFAKST